MDTRPLGSTGVRVPVLGCGTAGFSPALRLGGRLVGHGDAPESHARATIKEALAQGASLVDTSDWFGLGRVERLVGEAVREERERVFLVAKGGLVPDGGRHAVSDFSREHLLAASQRSLKRLGVKHVDLYLLHDPEPSDVTEGTWKALAEIKASGRARFVGAAVADVRFGERLAAEGRVDALMVPLNLVNQRATAKLLDVAKAAGVGVLARSPYAGGLLSGRRGQRPQYPADDWRSERWTPDYVSHAASIGALAEAIGEKMPLSELALRFALSHEVASVVGGFRVPEDVKTAAAAARRGTLPRALVQRLRTE